MFGAGCEHSENGKSMWEVKDKTVLPSALQQMDKAGISGRLSSVRPNMFTTKVILILVCGLCGKVNKTVEENY